jgi:hypothetical protein
MTASGWLLLLLLTAAAVVSCQEGPIVRIHQGALQGTFMVSRYGRQFFAFQGIPYAKSPTGELRFKVYKLHLIQN